MLLHPIEKEEINRGHRSVPSTTKMSAIGFCLLLAVWWCYVLELQAGTVGYLDWLEKGHV